MKRIQPVKVTYNNGSQTFHEVDMYNLPSLLSTLDMGTVTGIEYGEAIVNKGPAEFLPSGIQYSYSRSEGVYHMSVYNKDDMRVATGKFTPVRLQQFAVDMLQQTTYRFTDVQADHDHMEHRLEGLDK